MQVLLSRAAQARTTCRCVSCGQAARAVARRTTKATTKRRIGVNDVFTACYSSLIASAVIADAEVKRERRKDWDRAIEDARLGKLMSEVGEGEEELAATTYSKISARSSSIVDTEASPIVTSRQDYPLLGTFHNTSNAQFEGKLQSLHSQIKRSLENTTTLFKEQEDVVPNILGKYGEEWTDENPISDVGIRDFKKRVHLDKMEGTITRFVARILQKISIFSEPRSSDRRSSSHETETVLNAIQELRSGISQFPNYSWSDAKVLQKTRTALHKSIHRICQRATSEQSEIDLMLAKICYNLLISSAPPSIITFNILLGEFSRLQLHDAAELVIDSYFCDTTLSPTMETTRLMLDHYIAKRDRRGFVSMLHRMRCTVSNSAESTHKIGNMRIGVRGVKDLHNPRIQKWALQHKVIHRNGALLRLAPRDIGVFDSVIWGCLQLLDVRRAIQYLKQAIRECKVQEEWIYAVTEACVRQLDHRGAISLLQGILSSWKDEDGNVRLRFSKVVKHALHQLMALCGIDGTELFPRLKHQHYVRQDDLQELLLQLHIETARDNLEILSGQISDLHSAVSGQSLGGMATRAITTTSNGLEVPQESHFSKSKLQQSRLRLSRKITKRSQLSFLEFRLKRFERTLSDFRQEASAITDVLGLASQTAPEADVGDKLLLVSSTIPQAAIISDVVLQPAQRKPHFEAEQIRFRDRTAAQEGAWDALEYQRSYEGAVPLRQSMAA